MIAPRMLWLFDITDEPFTATAQQPVYSVRPGFYAIVTAEIRSDRINKQAPLKEDDEIIVLRFIAYKLEACCTGS